MEGNELKWMEDIPTDVYTIGDKIDMCVGCSWVTGTYVRTEGELIYVMVTYCQLKDYIHLGKVTGYHKGNIIKNL